MDPIRGTKRNLSDETHTKLDVLNVLRDYTVKREFWRIVTIQITNK